MCIMKKGIYIFKKEEREGNKDNLELIRLFLVVLLAENNLIA